MGEVGTDESANRIARSAGAIVGHERGRGELSRCRSAIGGACHPATGTAKRSEGGGGQIFALRRQARGVEDWRCSGSGGDFERNNSGAARGSPAATALGILLRIPGSGGRGHG